MNDVKQSNLVMVATSGAYGKLRSALIVQGNAHAEHTSIAALSLTSELHDMQLTRPTGNVTVLEALKNERYFPAARTGEYRCPFHIHLTEHVAGVYLDRLIPTETPARPTVLMLHGGSHTGACYLRTVDDRPGWAYRFLGRGFPVALADWPGHGRSGAVDLQSFSGRDLCAALVAAAASIDGPIVILTHSMAGAYGWSLIEEMGERIRAVVAVAPAPPGNIQPQPTIVAENDDALRIRVGEREFSLRNDPAIVSDEDFIRAKLIGSSQQFPAAHFESYRRSLGYIGRRLMYERLNVRGSQIRVRDPARLRGIPILVVTGSEDRDHPRLADTEVTAWLASHGARAKLLWLADEGVVGNGHMPMLELNSNVVADKIIEWLISIL